MYLHHVQFRHLFLVFDIMDRNKVPILSIKRNIENASKNTVFVNEMQNNMNKGNQNIFKILKWKIHVCVVVGKDEFNIKSSSEIYMYII